MGKISFEAGRNARLDDFLIKDCGISKRMLSRLKRTENGMTRNGELIRTVDRVCCGDVIVLSFEDSKTLEPNRELYVTAAFENENIIVFDKPAGMPVHPSIKHQGDTLGNYFAYRFPGLTFRPVNRLDKDTSGLCLTAKNAVSAAALQENAEKIYYAAVSGYIDGEGTIDAPIAREKESIIKRVVREDGQLAVTHYRAVVSGDRYSLLEIHLETGRTHQIRVHFAHIGHPLAGDDLYGGSREHIACQALHCGQLSFKEPVTGEEITVRSPVRDDIKALLKLNNKGEF
ncbi:MAG: RluA family pseudouridine synthase [Porcipelethomonas sp.]